VRWTLLLFALVLAFTGHAQHGRLHQRFEDPEQWAKVFDDPERDSWQKPDEVIRALRLPAGAVAADIGSGTGYFSVRLARALPQGKVYGADLESAMVRYLEERAMREKLANLSSYLASPDDAKLPEKVDLVLVVDTYHHIEQRIRYFRRLKDSLKPGGRVAIIDFQPDSPVGPHAIHRVAARNVIAEMGTAGYRLAAEHRFLPYQYFVVFEN
jgi:cyclopropane fatty-acyl-phospholipid synthase-like methyltransferase